MRVTGIAKSSGPSPPAPAPQRGAGEIEVWRMGWLCRPILQNPHNPRPGFTGRGQGEGNGESKKCPFLNRWTGRAQGEVSMDSTIFRLEGRK